MDCNLIVQIVSAAATLLVFGANLWSVISLKKQIKQSHDQYEDEQKLKIKPYLQMKIDDGIFNEQGKLQEPHEPLVISETKNDDVKIVEFKSISFRNIGLGTLHHTLAKWTSANGETTEVVLADDRVIPPNEELRFNVVFSAKLPKSDDPPIFKDPMCTLSIEYEDLVENKYIQKFFPSVDVTDTKIDFYYYCFTSPEPIEDTNNKSIHA